MKTGLPASIARRYLFSRKTHGAVSIISAVSVTGVAVATAALVCVLSVFNGFRSVLSGQLDILAPDVLVAPASGKTLQDASATIRMVSSDPDVALASPVVADNALAVYDSKEMPVRVLGVVPGDFARTTAVSNTILEGGRFMIEPSLERGPEDEYGLASEVKRGNSAVSVGVASRLGIYDMGSPLLLFTPRREGRLNPANPMNSFVLDSVAAQGVFQTRRNEYDDDLVITSIDIARHLFGYSTQATAIQITARKGADTQALARRLENTLGPEFRIKDRLEQHETSFRMIAIEKWVTFLLLFFILLIAGFNLISAMTMSVLDKGSQLATLHHLGMSRRSIGKVFAWESIYITCMGGAAGIVVGVVLCLLQQHFGFIRLNGDPEALVINTYPVAVEWPDLFIVMIPIAAVGALTARVASGFARQRVKG